MKWIPCLLLLASCTLEVGVPDSIYLYPRGRVSEPSPNVAPRGSLLRAENCVMREPGVLSPVPDLQTITSNGGPTNRYIDQFSPLFENGSVPQFLCHMGITGFSGTQSGVQASGSLGVEVTYTDPDGSSASIEYYDHGDGLTAFPMWLARDNLYLADKRGVYKWESTDDTSLIPVWDGSNVVLSAGVASSASGWLPVSEHVRYAAVAVYEDSNGVVRRSAPTLSSLVENGTGSDAYVSMLVYVLNDEAERDDFSHVEIYRTRSYASTVTPPNEFYLAAEVDESDLTASSDFNVYTGVVNDFKSDDLLSAAMYTSSSQGGAAAANISPPSGLYHAHFRGHEFWANIAEKEFFDPLLRIDDADVEHNLTGSIVITSGSNEVTGVTNLDGAQIGMLVADFSSGTQMFPSGTYITAISGSTVTMSENATSSGSDDFFAYDTAFIRWGDGSADRFAVGPLSNVFRTVASVYATFDVYDDPAFDVSMQFGSKHRVSRMGTAQMWVSYPGEYEDYTWADLNTASGAPTSGGTPAKPALHLRRIAWSKFQEPEVTTLTNSQDVGGSGDIVGLGALRDCLIILKTDGVYKLTGSNGNWRIDPIDTSVRIIGGRSTQVMGNAVYTLCDRGILRVTANRVTLLSDNVVNDWFKEDEELLGEPRLEDLRRYMADNDGYHPITLFSGADEFHQEYVLCCEGSDATYNMGASSSFLVYNAATSAFTTWKIADGTDPVGALGYARGDPSSFNFGNQSPGIVLSRRYSSSDDSAALHILDSRRDTKDAGYSQFTQDIAFRSLHEGDPTTLKIWREFAWDAESSSASKTAVFQRSERDSEVTQSIPSGETDEIRVWPPIEVARSSKPVVGIRGTGITIRGLRATFSASGRGVPLE